MSGLSGHVSSASREPQALVALNPVSTLAAHFERTDHALEALTCQLLFAANDLARSRTRVSSDASDEPVLLCEECHMCALGDAPIAHVKSCRVGRLAGILTRMCDAQSQSVTTYAPNRRKEDALAAEACAGDRNLSRGECNEPWGFQRTAWQLRQE